MKTTLNLTTAAVALVLFATSATLSQQASAADRQITVNPKNFTFTVNDDADKPADVAETEPGGQPKEKKPLKPVFKVPDESDLKQDASSQQDDESPAIPPKKKGASKFKVETQSEQAASPPDEQDDDEDVATSPAPPPAKLLNETAKLVKKPAAAPVENDDEATSDDTDQGADVADDKQEAVEGDVADTAEDVEAAPVESKKPRIYYYASKQKSYEKTHSDEADSEAYGHSVPTYEPTYYDYSGASCHNSYTGY
jgi:hypothetical protein